MAQDDPDPTDGPRAIDRGKVAAAGAAVVLLVLMFATAWYGADRPPGRTSSGAARETAADAWTSLSIVRWLMVLTILLALASLVLHLMQRRHGAETETAAPLLILATLTAAVLVDRVLVDLPSPRFVVDQKLGAYLGMLSAFAIALAAYHSLRTARIGRRALRRPRQRSAQ